jgi:outer membrane protein OmpA-like peptidoglycan-associated protein
MRRSPAIVSAVLAGALLAAAPARADETLLPMNADSAQIESAFGAGTDFTANSFRLPDNVRPQPLAPGQPVSVPADGHAIGVPGIQFEYGSDTLTTASQALVDRIAEVLARKGLTFVVIGHTDASGDPSVNLDLSQRRALTVAYYMVNAHGIPRDRVTYTGVGAAFPIWPTAPYAPENRRVTFVYRTN